MDTRNSNRRPGSGNALHAPKLLLPVDATERSRWGIQYAVARKQTAPGLVVSLLYVAEPVTAWQVLRFWTEDQARRFQAERANHLLEDAAEPLRQAGIPVETNYREGGIMFEILDVAEQLGCDEIVLPTPHSRLAGLFSTDVVSEIVRRKRSVPVTTVDSRGVPERGRRSALPVATHVSNSES